MSAVDDCREVDQTFEDKDASTCSAIIGIKATALGCGSRIDEDITEIDVTVAIDSKKPEVTCELGTQDLYGKGYGDFADLDFSFTAIDECTDTDDLAVTIEVLSNEKVAIGDEVSHIPNLPFSSLLYSYLHSLKLTSSPSPIFVTLQNLDGCVLRLRAG